LKPFELIRILSDWIYIYIYYYFSEGNPKMCLFFIPPAEVKLSAHKSKTQKQIGILYSFF
jgi:hypothetical protein